MKYLKLSFLVLFLHLGLVGYAQNQDTLGLKRLFWNVIPGVGIDYGGKKIVTDLGGGSKHTTGGAGVAVAGIQYEVGNYWVLDKKNNTTGFFRLTWARVGVHVFGLLIAPAHIGGGVHIDFKQNLSLDIALNAGLLIATDDALDPEFEFDYAVYPQIKFNINRFSLGFEYTYKKYYNGYLPYPKGGHYFGLVLGGVVGKRIN